jgi:hypothetical protein
MPFVSGGPCKCACVFSFLHAKLRVHRASGIPCALDFSKVREFLAKLGRVARRDRESVSSSVIAREGGRSSTPRLFDSIIAASGILDRPVNPRSSRGQAPGDDVLGTSMVNRVFTSPYLWWSDPLSGRF